MTIVTTNQLVEVSSSAHNNMNVTPRTRQRGISRTVSLFLQTFLRSDFVRGFLAALLLVGSTRWSLLFFWGEDPLELSTATVSSSASSPVRVVSRTIEDIEVLVGLPTNRQLVSGVLFLAHPCGRSHTHWFPKSQQDCPNCKGLPEERAIVDVAVNSLGMAVVAISASNQKTKCWTVEEDRERVGLVLEDITQHLVADNLAVPSFIPLLALGSGNGGVFVQAISYELQLNGFVSLDAASPTTNQGITCQVYITYDRDVPTGSMATSLVQRLESCQQVQGKHLMLMPLKIHDLLFSKRIPEVSDVQSRRLVKVLRDHSFVNADGYLSERPQLLYTQYWWIQALQSSGLLQTNPLKEYKNTPIFQILQLAYGWGREVSREGVQEALSYCLYSPFLEPNRPKEEEEEESSCLIFQWSEDHSWDELPDREQQAAKLLGYDPVSWNTDVESQGLFATPWNALSKAQQRAALQLGYTKKDWKVTQ
eukprot:Nitzschia sp. Nitz4//scaffold101_size76361//15538//17057//NITZ4_005595-RA/size76361-augustus-gene-0.22-mRNA-1//-1//CDS//3329532137//6845//frame0